MPRAPASHRKELTRGTAAFVSIYPQTVKENPSSACFCRVVCHSNKEVPNLTRPEKRGSYCDKLDHVFLTQAINGHN